MGRARDCLADAADNETEQLQREQRPGDRLQALRIGIDERVAGAHRPDDREQPLEDEIVDRNGDEAEQRDRAQPHHQPRRVRRRRDLERGHDPLFVGHDHQQREDRRAGQPVQDDDEAQHHVRDPAVTFPPFCSSAAILASIGSGVEKPMR